MKLFRQCPVSHLSYVNKYHFALTGIPVYSCGFQCGDGDLQEPEIPSLGPRGSDRTAALLEMLLLGHERSHLRG